MGCGLATPFTMCNKRNRRENGASGWSTYPKGSDLPIRSGNREVPNRGRTIKTWIEFATREKGRHRGWSI